MKKLFQNLKLFLTTIREGELQQKTAEMNILTHMQYMHDSKIRPETLESMGKVLPEIVYEER